MRAFLAAALLAIVVAAALLAVLGYLSLRHWEASAELLFREQARDMASMAAEKVDMVLARTEDDIVARIAGAAAARELTPAILERLVAATPLVQRLYLFDRRGQLASPAAWEPSDAGIFVGLLAENSQGL